MSNTGSLVACASDRSQLSALASVALGVVSAGPGAAAAEAVSSARRNTARDRMRAVMVDWTFTPFVQSCQHRPQSSSLLDVSSTPLERALRDPRPTPVDALALARRRWLAGERLDMGALAKELGVSRATLYSWVGSRERLIGEVIWSF